MRIFRAAAAITCAGAALAGCAPRAASPARADADEERNVFAFECGQVVAIGRIRTLNYTAIENPDDLIGHGLFTMQLTIRRVLHGQEKRKSVIATQVAHGQPVANRDFVMLLSPKGDGSYVLTSAALWHMSPRPIIPAQCTPAKSPGAAG